MANKNPFDTYHVSPLFYDQEGYPVAEAPFTDTSDTKRHAVVAPPDKVIPVILVPGIMGSNLKLKKLPEGFAEKRYTEKVKGAWKFPPVERTTTGWGDKAWHPDDKTRFAAQRLWPLEAFERRRLLDPTNTEVDDRTEVAREHAFTQPFVFESTGDGKEQAEMGEQRSLGFLKEMKRRGWSTVMQGCYVPFLAFMEYNLNRMFYIGDLNDFWQNKIIADSQSPSQWGILKGAKPVTADDVKKAARYWFPVHAVGYNWTQSNKESAQHLLRKIDEFTKRFRTMGYECEKVILVTHSMGGLVARAAAHAELGQNLNGAADRILGIVHGVMPTHGAAAAYRRCHAGFEGASIGWGMDATARILGKNGPEVAAVFSNCPGALELLPSKLYGPGWLKIAMPGGSHKALPEADPYKEIYEQKDSWWRLMNPAWVDPASGLTREERDDSWDKYLSNLDKAAFFHGKLGATHHTQTCVHYSADNDKHKAYGSLTWGPAKGEVTGNVAPPECTTFTEANSGEVTLTGVTVRDGRMSYPTAKFTLSDQDEAGDGTVPVRSARALNATVEIAAAHSAGYDHQDGYGDHRTRELTAYAIVRTVAQHMP